MIVKTVESLEGQGVKMFSCGNNFELEYLLSGSRHFKHCSELKKNFKKPAMLVSYFVDEKFVIAMRHDDFGGDFLVLPSEILQECNQEYLTTENFSLRWCRK